MRIWVEHRTEKWKPVFGITRCANKKLERRTDFIGAVGALVTMLSALLLFSVQARADGYAAWFDGVSNHLRTAASYLRTENTDLAGLSVDELSGALANMPGDAPNSVKSMVAETRPQMSAMLDVIDAGETARPREQLLTMRRQFFEAHQAAGVKVFPDCIYQLGTLGPAFFAWQQARPDMSVKATGEMVNKTARAYLDQVRQCRQIAPEAVAEDDRFKRLVGDAVNGLELVPETVEQNDLGRLIRIIRELKSLDNLLFFRFG